MSESERSDFETWLKDAENHRVYEEYLKLWSGLEEPGPGFSPDIDKSWETFVQKKKRMRYYYIPAVIMLLCLLLIIFSPSDLIFKTKGELHTVTLDDGTLVELNHHSQIIVPDNFLNDSIRYIRLDGEAFFKVKNNQRPFLIKTDAFLIRVLGTSFNVSDRKSNKFVYLKNGRLKLHSSEVTTTVFMENGDHYVLDKNRLINSKKAEKDILNWRLPYFEFKNRELSSVTNELSEFYNVKISQSKKLSNSVLTAKLDKKQSIDYLLAVIVDILDVKLSKKSTNHYVIGVK